MFINIFLDVLSSSASGSLANNNDDIEPLKFTDKGEIIPNYPLLSKKQILTQVTPLPSTKVC
jgi:hypothetical protein